MIDFKTPEELKELLDFEVKDEGIDDNAILGLCQSVLKYSVNTRKFDRLPCMRKYS